MNGCGQRAHQPGTEAARIGCDDQQQSARCQQPQHRAQRRLRRIDMLDYVEPGDQVEAGRIMRRILDAPLEHASHARPGAGRRTCCGGQLDAVRLPAGVGRGRQPHAGRAADFEQAPTGRAKALRGAKVRHRRGALAGLDRLVPGVAEGQRAPLISLWGPGRPEFYAPRVERHRIVYERYPCSPCLYMISTFEGMRCSHEGGCMHAIQPESVVAAVEAELARGRRESGPAR
jgi:hypothetical protein